MVGVDNNLVGTLARVSNTDADDNLQDPNSRFCRDAAVFLARHSAVRSLFSRDHCQLMPVEVPVPKRIGPFQRTVGSGTHSDETCTPRARLLKCLASASGSYGSSWPRAEISVGE